MKKYVIILGVVAVLVAGFLVFKGQEKFGGYLVPTITETSAQLVITTSSVNEAGTNLQRLVMWNRGLGMISCSFATSSVLGTGLQINSAASTTNTMIDITDPNLLNKAMNCIASETSTVSILKY